MAWTSKFTATRGKPNVGDIVKSAGSAETGRDMISLNIDADKMSKGDAIMMLDGILAAIHKSSWPVN